MAELPKFDVSRLASQDTIDYFLSAKQTGYDVPKTVIFALILIAAAYVVYKALKRLRIRIDERLALAVAPYILFGSCLRVIQDAGLVDSYLFVTPGIYVFVFSIFFGSMLLALVLQKKFGVPYYKTLFIIGLLTLPFIFSQLDFVRPEAMVLVGLFFSPWLVLFKFVKWSATNKIVTLLHMFDSTTTFVAMSFFGYYEQHVVPTVLINAFSPISFVIVKFVVIVSVLYLIDRFSEKEEDKEFIAYVKLIIGILGAATGSRDLITLVAGM